MHTAALVLTCCLAAALGQGTATVGQTCRVDDAGTRGDCRTLSQCPELLRIAQLARSGRVGSEAVADLRRLVAKCPTGSPPLLICCQNEVTRRVTTPPPERIAGSPLLPGEDVCGKSPTGMRVIGGVDAEIAQFPWMASVQYVTGPDSERQHGCGATLITSRHVLTAAHCVTFLSDPAVQPVSVILGELDFGSEIDCSKEFPDECADPPIEVEISAIFFHPEFQNIARLALPRDIAVVQLAEEVTFTDFIRPICVLTDLSVLEGTTDIDPDGQVVVAGWGRSEIGGQNDFTAILQTATLPVRPLTSCERDFDFEELGLEGRICAGAGPNSSDTCRGDSGGPLMVPVRQGVRWYQTGISSFGTGECGKLAGYTRVLDYTDWILEQLRMP
ncbi:serine protease easter-like [Pollicipes pollicipes]|uniref:serine protease easter-like n=1 Tax=Pollicipes pollicipes TaxID=41117 RepID=UPI001885316A|nr:serine protease easter-like [Pollicipes pollicipes]